MFRKFKINLIKLNRVFSWILALTSIVVILTGYGLTVFNVERAFGTVVHYVLGIFFAFFFLLHMLISVVLIRYNWRTQLRKTWNLDVGSFTLLRLAQRVSGWLITASAMLILLSGLDWFKILPGWLLPFTYHIRFDLLLTLSIIIHVAIGLKFALTRRRIRIRKISPAREVSSSRRESIIVLTGMFLSLIATIYLDVIPRFSIKMGEKLGLLPPGQYEVGKLQVLHVGPVPEFDDESWTFEVYGSVENQFILSYDEVKKLPKITSVSDFHCVTGWTKFSNKWEGVQFKTIVQMAKPHTESRFATIECENDYTTSLPLDELVKDDVILAYGLDDKELAPEHGGPLRLVVPQKYGYKSAKWVRKIKFTEEQELGYWEIRGYSNTADPFKNDRYSR